VIVFHPLGEEEILRIVEIQLRRVHATLAAKGIVMEVTEGARKWIAAQGFDPQFGARPLKRVIQKQLVNPLAEMILRDEVHEGDTLKVDTGAGGALSVGVVPAAAAG